MIELRMRAGGREIEQVQTHTPGQVEFIPAKEGEKRRQMNAQRLNIDYGADNMVREFRAAGEVATRTESLGRGGKPVVAITRSQDLKAEFNEKTGEMTRLEQWTDFEYEEGARRATAGHAELDQAREVITLRTKARMWDEAGSTAANEIVLEQKSGDMRATGQVSSTRVPDKKDASGGMLAGGEPLRAQAQRMTATDRNRKIRYDGDALMWQGASRLRAQVIVIDREQDTLSADGDVVSTLPDQSAEDKTKKRKNVLTTVRAASLVYSDKTKLAHYTGGTRLERPGLEVVSRELRVWLREDKDAKGASETRLERAFADGDVRIVERAADRTREGAGEHAEYYPEEERMVLNGGNPVVSDSKRGVSRGREITWYARQDRLIVDNTGSGPSVSRIQRDERR